MKLFFNLIMVNLAACSLMQAQQAPALSDFNHQAAFVLPLTLHNEREMILLGREAAGNDQGLYDSFGGKRDYEDGSHPVVTAAREFYEEAITRLTLDMPFSTVRHYIDLKAGNTEYIFAVQSMRGNARHVVYLSNFSPTLFQQLKETFGFAFENAPAGRRFREKDEIASVFLSDVLEAIVDSRSNRGIQVIAHVIDLRGNRSTKLITLRPIFARMLRGYAEARAYVEGKDPRIRFYTL